MEFAEIEEGWEGFGGDTDAGRCQGLIDALDFRHQTAGTFNADMSHHITFFLKRDFTLTVSHGC